VGALDAFAGAIVSLGTHRFDLDIMHAINTIVGVDHLTVLTYCSGEGLRALLIASRADEAKAQSLTRDYVAHQHVFDPNFPDLTRMGRSRKLIVRRHDPQRLKTKRYQERFYTTVGIVDKVSFLWRTGETSYYANLYRTHRSGHYTQEEIRLLGASARFIASAIGTHGGRKRIEAALAAGDSTAFMTRLIDRLGDRLTPREQAVLTRIVMGMGTEGIALDLGVAPATIITFRRRAYAKLGITSQAELFARCLRVIPRPSMVA
jgi:DNA-binding CsgD family transcriptional regulator